MGALEVRYRYGSLPLERAREQPGLWQWKSLLPDAGADCITSLGEGSSPLVPIRREPGRPRILIKNETANPTWSYKDRANTLSVSMARRFGLENLCTISTGNHGNSAAAYSSAGGVRCIVFCGAEVPCRQTSQMRLYGAEVLVGGNQQELLLKLINGGGWYPAVIVCPRAGCANPYGIEGYKTIAFEIQEQLLGRIPDRVFVPVGSGDGFYGIAKGFRELVLSGRASRMPKMMACQTVAANPFVRAFREGRRTLTRVVGDVSTVALSIGERIGGQPALHAIYESGGEALEVEESEIRRITRWLAGCGLALEPSSATALAGALVYDRSASEEETWVVIGTGTALRWPQSCDDNLPVA